MLSLRYRKISCDCDSLKLSSRELGFPGSCTSVLFFRMLSFAFVQPKLAVIELLYLDEGKITSWKRICQSCQWPGFAVLCYSSNSTQTQDALLISFIFQEHSFAYDSYDYDYDYCHKCSPSAATNFHRQRVVSFS